MFFASFFCNCTLGYAITFCFAIHQVFMFLFLSLTVGHASKIHCASNESKYTAY
jgi:hypothetical protein